MRTVLLLSALLLFAVPLAAGCGPPVERVRGRDGDAVLRDLERLKETLTPEDAAAFGKAYRVLLGLTVLEHQDDIDKMQHAIRRKFNGKSVAQIVAEYEALAPEERQLFAAGAGEAPQPSATEVEK